MTPPRIPTAHDSCRCPRGAVDPVDFDDVTEDVDDECQSEEFADDLDGDDIEDNCDEDTGYFDGDA